MTSVGELFEEHSGETSKRIGIERSRKEGVDTRSGPMERLNGSYLTHLNVDMPPVRNTFVLVI